MSLYSCPLRKENINSFRETNFFLALNLSHAFFISGASDEIMDSAFDCSFLQKALNDCSNGCFLYPPSLKAEGVNLKCVKEFL